MPDKGLKYWRKLFKRKTKHKSKWKRLKRELTITIIKCKYVLNNKGPKDLWITQEVSKTIIDIKKKKEWKFKY